MPSPPSTSDTSAGETRAQEPGVQPGLPWTLAGDMGLGAAPPAPPRETSGLGALSLSWMPLSSTELLRSSP